MTNILHYEKEKNYAPLNTIYENYHTQGFVDAGKVGGSEAAFSISLENFYSTVILEADLKNHNIAAKESEYEATKRSILEKIDIHKSEINNITEKYLPELEEELKAAEDNLAEFKVNPQKFVKYEIDSLKLWLFGTLTLFVAIFLYFFYSSVIYSAVFRDITITKYTIFNSIFYPKAFEEAYVKGFSAFMLTIFSPFVFMALGIILDHIKSQKKQYKINYWFIGATAFVFLVDALLAYHISERIHNSKAINTYGNVSPYYLKDAIADANFWIIIALGFVVYMIFGKIFSMYNDERKSKNVFDNYERMLIENISRVKGKIAEYKNKIIELEDEINQLQYKEAETIKIKEKVFFSVYEIKKILTEYTLGWIKYLKNANYHDDYISKIEIKLNHFINEKRLNENEK